MTHKSSSQNLSRPARHTHWVRSLLWLLMSVLVDQCWRSRRSRAGAAGPHDHDHRHQYLNNGLTLGNSTSLLTSTPSLPPRHQKLSLSLSVGHNHLPSSCRGGGMRSVALDTTLPFVAADGGGGGGGGGGAMGAAEAAAGGGGTMSMPSSSADLSW